MAAGEVVEEIQDENDPATTEEAAPAAAPGMRIRSGKRKRPRRVMLYGVQGVGKSTWANCAPAAVFVPTEEGINDIECDSFPEATSYKELMDNLAELANQPHEYRTVIIDSLDWLERLIWADVCSLKGVANIGDIGYGKGYAMALGQWNELLRALDYLRKERGMFVILVAHSRIEKYENPETEGYDRHTPCLHKSAAALVQEWCDEVLFATYRVYTHKHQKDDDGGVAKGIGGTERIVRTTEKPFAVAKNRLGMPDEIPLDFKEYTKYL